MKSCPVQTPLKFIKKKYLLCVLKIWAGSYSPKNCFVENGCIKTSILPLHFIFHKVVEELFKCPTFSVHSIQNTFVYSLKHQGNCTNESETIIEVIYTLNFKKLFKRYYVGFKILTSPFVPALIFVLLFVRVNDELSRK